MGIDATKDFLSGRSGDAIGDSIVTSITHKKQLLTHIIIIVIIFS